MGMRAVLVAINTTWVAPTDVTCIFLSEVGSGSGAQMADPGFGRNTGGAGSGEYMSGLPILVIPGVGYNITIGAKGLGANEVETGWPSGPTPGTYTQAFGYKALTGGIYRGEIYTGAQSAGDGGGCGGGLALAAGDGGSWGAVQPKQESHHYFGGAAGGGGTPTYLDDLSSSSGGKTSTTGIVFDGNPGGGGGGGSIWGATDGGQGYDILHIDRSIADAANNHYGAGAGGTGGGIGNRGGNGANGVALLVYFN